MVENLNPSIDQVLQGLVESGCTAPTNGTRRTLYDQDGRPVVEIDSNQRVAVFLDEFHQTAGLIEDLKPLIAAFDEEGYRIGMD